MGGIAEGRHYLERHWQQLRHRQCLSQLRGWSQISRSRIIRSLRLWFSLYLGAKIGKPDVPVVGFAGDGAFGISMNELTACGRNDWLPITMVVFRNFQWGAEKRNTTLWYSDNFVGTELNLGVGYAEVAKACGLKGVKVDSTAALEDALKTAIEGQMQRKETTLIEVVLNQELGEPFRRDAMTAPVQVAGISAADMRA